jgi:hypothetical protein
VDQCGAAQLEAAVENFLVNTPRHLPSIYVTREIPPEHESGFLSAVDVVVASVESHHRARVTRQQDAFAWQRHLFENSSDYIQRRLPDAWEGALAGLPAFICGAGPSLDVSAPALARVAAGGVIFAADSSLRRIGAADFAVSVDMAKYPAKCLPATGGPERVILSVNSPPGWAQAIPEDRRYYVSSNQLTLDWMAGMGIARTKVGVCENCGSTAIEVARYMGCAPIYLFGMDLALNDEGQRHHGHVDASIYTKSGFKAEQEFPRVPGNFSAEVPTHVIGDWRALDRRLAGWPAGLVWVVTDRGARLSNTTVVRPEDFSLPDGERRKEAWIEALPKPAPAPREAVGRIAGKFGQFGARLVEWAPSLLKALETGGAGAVAASLQSLFATPENGQILGAYSLKLMPRLLPPIEEGGTDWEEIIGELEVLGASAVRAAAALRKE